MTLKDFTTIDKKGKQKKTYPYDKLMTRYEKFIKTGDFDYIDSVNVVF